MAATLLSPVTVGKIALKNRVVMPPLTRARAGTSKLANKYIAEHYAMRASAGLVIAEAVAVSEQGTFLQNA
jgi:N-ethylmaleimide reductase